MSLVGNLVTQVELNSSGDAVFDIIAHKPYQLVNSFPDIIQSCDLLDGLWGTLGCIIFVNYTQEGEKKSAQVTIGAVDENNKSVTYQVLEGDLLLLYTTISVTLQIGTQDGKNIATWTMNYLKLIPISPDPTALMDLAVTMTKGIGAANL